MRLRVPVLATVVLLGFVARFSAADVVKLTNGRTLHGAIIEENDAAIVLKMTDGSVRIERDQIRSIERETAAATKLGAARTLAAAADRRAELLFQQAIDEAERADDAATAARARTELEDFRATSSANDREGALQKLERARSLAKELSRAARPFFEEAIALARRADAAEVASAAISERDAFRARLAARGRELHAVHLGEARALARELAPAAVSRYEDAIADAEDAEDRSLLLVARKELEELRAKLDAAGALPDESVAADAVATLEAKLARGDRAAGAKAVRLIWDRARAAHEKEAFVDAVRSLERAQAALHAIAERGRLSPELEQYAREIDFDETTWRREACGRAIRAGDGATAIAMIEPLSRPIPGKPTRYACDLYFDGRAREANGDAAGARASFESAVGGMPGLSDATSLDVWRYLARLRAQGESVSASTPGVGAQWKRSEGAHVVFFTERDEITPESARLVEATRTKALQQLGIAEPFGIHAVKTPVFVYASDERYRAVASRAWSGGHAALTRLEDGAGSAIVTFVHDGTDVPGLLQHEFAHVLVDEALQGARLPDWVIEGVAEYAEGGAELLRMRRSLRAPPTSIDAYLRETTDGRYRSDNSDEANQFYAEASVVFEACVDKAGSVKIVLDAARKLEKQGRVDEFLKALKVDDVDDLDREVRKLAAAK